jgi:hypothetical protein
MNVWGESSAVDRICKTFANSVEEAKELEKRNRKKTKAVARRSFDQKMEQHKTDMKQFSIVLDAEKAKQEKGEPMPPSHKEIIRKQKQAAKDAARQARTLKFTKKVSETAMTEKEIGKNDNNTNRKTFREPKETNTNKAQHSKKTKNKYEQGSTLEENEEQEDEWSRFKKRKQAK